MKRKVVARAAIVLMLSSVTATAADYSRGRAPYYTAPTPLAYSWIGPYLGINVGYQSGSVTNNPTEPSGIMGGLQGGYNWQTGPLVLGAEADLQVSGADDTFAPWKFSNPWFGTVRGRGGYALNNILFYATLGLALGRGRGESVGVSESRTHFGWAAGLGMEVGFARNWSARVEYLYVDLSDRGYAVTGVNNGFESSLLRFGFNYRF